jgi:hypothetical protein
VVKADGATLSESILAFAWSQIPECERLGVKAYLNFPDHELLRRRHAPEQRFGEDWILNGITITWRNFVPEGFTFFLDHIGFLRGQIVELAVRPKHCRPRILSETAIKTFIDKLGAWLAHKAHHTHSRRKRHW